MEICAPAGNMQALKAAVYNGADAVYLGLDRLNLRMKADNFNVESLKQATDFAHLFGTRVFVALNSCIKQAEYSQLDEIIEYSALARPDAYIITDLSLIDKIRQKAPSVRIHMSTQAGVHNVYGAKLLEEAGAHRVVLARETELCDILKIKENTGLEVEAFVHGALCVSFSGACLLSSITTGASGNRGACAQPCRRYYTAEGGGGYLLSPKDLCLLERLDALKSIDAIKIEGRLKRPEYVAEMTRLYRKAVDGGAISPEDMQAAKSVYNRGGFCGGYLFGGDIISKEAPGHTGRDTGRIDKITRVGAGASELTVSSAYSYNAGDGCKITRNGAEISGGELIKAEKTPLIGDGGEARWTLTARLNGELRVGDRINITSDKKQLESALRRIKRLPLDMELSIKIGRPATLKMQSGETEYVAQSKIAAEESLSRPLSVEQAIENLSRVNHRDDVFEPRNIEAHIDENAFFPLSLLNALRREAVEAVKSGLLSAYEGRRPVSNGRQKASAERVFVIKAEAIGWDKKIIAEIDCADRLCEALNVCERIVFYPPKYSKKALEAFFDAYKSLGIPSKVYLKLPLQAASKDLEIIEALIKAYKGRIDGLAGDNVYALGLAKKYGLPYIAGLFHNVYNDEAAAALAALSPFGVSFLESAELNSAESAELKAGGYLFAYGYLPLMHLKHCPQKTAGRSCGDCKAEIELCDEKCRYTVARTQIHNCYHTLYNPYV
ncbi:MAG: U32 family peptidase, partial [Clostridiales bacterium]|nr:U32 family peptidase [Clostridiales bacterium]